MAANDLPVSLQPQVDDEQESLKYLDVVQKAAKEALPCVSKAYDYAKENSGSLKPGVETIEGTLNTAVSPAIDKFHDVPVEVLKFADLKVDEAVNKAKSTTVANDIKNHGVVETASGLAKCAYTKIEPTAKDLLVKSEPVAEQQAASAWESLNKMPLFDSVAKAVIPTATYVSEKYNEAVKQTTEDGDQASSFLPLVPTEKIAKVFKAPETEGDPESVVSSGEEKA